MSAPIRPDLPAKLTHEQRHLLEERLKYWTEKLQPLIDAVRESERITAADLAIVINRRDEDKP